MDFTFTEVAQGLVGLVVIVGTAFLSLRTAARKVSSDIPQFMEDRAHGDFIQRMQQEVARLEAIILKMQARIEELEHNSGRVADRLVLVRAEAIDVYARLAGVKCECLAHEEWTELQKGMRRIIDLPHMETSGGGNATT